MRKKKGTFVFEKKKKKQVEKKSSFDVVTFERR